MIPNLPNALLRCKSDGRTLLHRFADRENCEELLTLLIKAGIPVDALDQERCSALHVASQDGLIANSKLLCSLGCRLDLRNSAGKSVLECAISSGNADLVRWMLEQPALVSLGWDNQLFYGIMASTPEATMAFLDKFALQSHYGRHDSYIVEYKDLRLVYGQAHVKVEDTALAIAVQMNHLKNVLTHHTMKRVMKVKWSAFVRIIFLKEFAVYLTLVLSYYVTVIWLDQDWIHFLDATDYAVAVLRAIAWACCVYLVVAVELLKVRVGGYIRSPWNWLTMVTYGSVLVSIPLEFTGASTNEARHGIIVFFTVALWMNMMQFLRVSQQTGLLIAMMERMLRDVAHFLVLYSIILLGFNGAFYIMFHGSAGYTNFIESLITVLLMLFGNLTYDTFGAATGWKLYMSNILLFVHLMVVVVMLLNILIAMLSSTYATISDEAEDQYWLRNAEIILRIERRLPSSVRHKQYVQMTTDYARGLDAKAAVAASSSTVSPVLNLTEPKTSEKRDQKVVPNMMEVDYPDDAPAAQSNEPQVVLSADFLYNEKVKDMKRKLKPLQDGYREEKATNASKTEKLAPDMVARFDGLTALVASTNAQASMQISDLAAALAELQKRPQCVCQHTAQFAYQSNQEVRGPRLSDLVD